MNRLSRILGALATLLAVALVPATATAQPADTIRTVDYDVRDLTFPDLRDFDVPDPQRVELDNGMLVLLLEDPELPQVNAIARIGTGSVYEPAAKVGLASVMGQVMRTGGTQSMSSDSINLALENVGASVETGMSDDSGYAFMSTLSDHVDRVLPIFADILREPAFAQEKVQVAKSQQKSAISRRNDQPQQIAYRELDKIIYGADSPYARTPEYYTIDRITQQDLVDFHAQYFHPNNTMLAVWGDFDADAMAEKIRDAFGDWERAEDFEPPTPPEPTAERERTINMANKEDVNQSTVLIGHIGEVTRQSDDYPALVLMNEVLAGGFSSRLFQNVRKEQGLAYAVFGSYTAGYNQPGRFRTGLFTKSSTTVEGAQAVLTEVEKMREAPPSEEELSLAKDSYLNSFVFNFDSEREVLSRQLTYEYYGYPSDFLQQTRDGIEAVDAADVQRVAQEYMHPSESHIVVVGKRSDFSGDLATLAPSGEVNELDISIPTSPPTAESDAAPMSEADQAAGLQALRKVKAALGGDAFAEIETMKISGTQATQTPQGTVDLGIEISMAMPDKYHIVRNTPMGAITVTINGDTGQIETPQGTQAIPSQQMQTIKGEFWRDMTYLMTRLGAEGLSVQDQGMQTVEGTEYRALRVQPPTGNAFTLFVDPGSMLPQRMNYTAMTRQGPQESTDVFQDYQEISGIQMPQTTVTYQGGSEAATTTLDNVTINADLESGLFQTSDSSGSSE